MNKIIASLILSIGLMYGARVDISEGKELLIKCNKGDNKACLQFSRMYFIKAYNENDNKDIYRVTVEPFTKACNANIGEACDRLAELYIFKLLEKKEDITKGDMLLEKACNLGYSRSCAVLGFYCEKAIHKQKNYNRALKLYRKGCELDKKKSPEEPGYMYGCKQVTRLKKLMQEENNKHK